jgi:transketolase
MTGRHTAPTSFGRSQPAGFQLAGLSDVFLDAGALPTLHDRYGISREALGARVKGWLG